MKRKRLLAWILCLVMIFSNAISVAAEENATGIATEENAKSDQGEENAKFPEQTGTEGETKSEEAKQETEQITEQVTESSADTAQRTDNSTETEQIAVQNNDSENVDASVWKVEDFTYTSYEKDCMGVIIPEIL